MLAMFAGLLLIAVADCYPQWVDCNRQLKVGSVVMAAQIQESSNTSAMLALQGMPIKCGSTVKTGTTYSYVYTGADSTNSWLIEATDASVSPFPGTQFSLPITYNGFVIYDSSIRNSVASFMLAAYYNNSNYNPHGKSIAVCSSRTMQPSGTVTFSFSGLVYIRIVWASFFAPVYTNNCSYIVQQSSASVLKPCLLVIVLPILLAAASA